MFVVDIHEFEKMHIKIMCQLSPGNEESLELLTHTFIMYKILNYIFFISNSSRKHNYHVRHCDVQYTTRHKFGNTFSATLLHGSSQRAGVMVLVFSFPTEAFAGLNGILVESTCKICRPFGEFSRWFSCMHRRYTVYKKQT